MELLHFTADWCVPCQRMKPIIDMFLEDNPNLKYTKIDIEEDFETAKQYQVMSIPTFIVMKDEEVINRHTGMADYVKIKSLFN